MKAPLLAPAFLTLIWSTYAFGASGQPVPVAPPETEVIPAEGPGEKPKDDGVEWSLLPGAAGNSDVGIIAGLAAVAMGVEEGYEPWRWRFDGGVSMAFKETGDTLELPRIKGLLRVDTPLPVSVGVRFVAELAGERLTNAGWFGLGNDSVPMVPLLDDDGAPIGDPALRHRYTRNEARAQLLTYWTVFKGVALVGGAQVRWLLPEVNEGSQLWVDVVGGGVIGTATHTVLELKAGAVMDTRNDPVWPTSGMHHELAVRLTPEGITGTDFTWAGVTAHGRVYVPVYSDSIVLAIRSLADVLFGDVPFHEMSRGGTFDVLDMLGGPVGLRGVPEGRYQGRAKVLGSVEIRSLFGHFDFLGRDLRFGVAVATDFGRVWADVAPDGESYHWSVGGGPRLKWGNTIARADFMYSYNVQDAGGSLPFAIYVALGEAF